MGLSAKDSRIYYMSPECPIDLSGTPPDSISGSGNLGSFYEQVTRIEINPTVSQRKYAHDKSYGTQDVCSGIKSWDGSISTRIASGTNACTFSAGDIVWIVVYPLGVACGSPIQGYAVIDSDPIVMNIENGEPVEHNYRFSSKGLWTGFVNDGQVWGGFECECGNSSTIANAMPAVEPQDLEDSDSN